jgi:hypothetical protein
MNHFDGASHPRKNHPKYSMNQNSMRLVGEKPNSIVVLAEAVPEVAVVLAVLYCYAFEVTVICFCRRCWIGREMMLWCAILSLILCIFAAIKHLLQRSMDPA